jgi:HIT zinc finger
VRNCLAVARISSNLTTYSSVAWLNFNSAPRPHLGPRSKPNHQSQSLILFMTGATDAPSSQSGHPTTTSPQCIICSEHVAIYTCPRCAIPTCSLPCSVTHKTSTGCSGVRDKTKFVPINGYTYGTMMDDYVFLENMGKRVSDWGRDIVRGGYETIQSRRGRGGRMGRGNKPRDGISRKKRDMLRSQLELRDVEIDLLPTGMERRTRNQSAWDPKCVTTTALYHRLNSHNDSFFPSAGRGQPF